MDFLKRYRFVDDENYGRNYISAYGDKKSRKQLDSPVFFSSSGSALAAAAPLAPLACPLSPLLRQGISKEGDILDLAVKENIIEKSGAWYAYQGAKIGQGRENPRAFHRRM